MIDYIVVHCSESPDGRDDRAADIHRWHIEKSWAGVGYHAVICRDGAVEDGRPHYWHGAHVRGYNNRSLGVCLIGTSEYTEEQWRALKWLLRSWKAQYPNAQIVGHCDLDNSKTCPNFDVKNWWVSQ